MSFHGLQPFGSSTVAPRHFYFTITAFTFDHGASSREEISQTDLWHWWHPMTCHV